MRFHAEVDTGRSPGGAFRLVEDLIRVPGGSTTADHRRGRPRRWSAGGRGADGGHGDAAGAGGRRPAGRRARNEFPRQGSSAVAARRPGGRAGRCPPGPRADRRFTRPARHGAARGVAGDGPAGAYLLRPPPASGPPDAAELLAAQLAVCSTCLCRWRDGADGGARGQAFEILGAVDPKQKAKFEIRKHEIRKENKHNGEPSWPGQRRGSTTSKNGRSCSLQRVRVFVKRLPRSIANTPGHQTTRPGFRFRRGDYSRRNEALSHKDRIMRVRSPARRRRSLGTGCGC